MSHARALRKAGLLSAHGLWAVEAAATGECNCAILTDEIVKRAIM